MGARLSEHIHDIPKGFIQFGDKPIIEESIEKLLEFNIEEIIIVTGYLSHFYEELARRFSCIVITHNEKFSISGSMYSLYCARNFVKDDFLLLESDLIYESRAIEELLDYPESDVILISGFTNAGDEVFVETKDNKLVNMSKDTTELKNYVGELVGISRVSMGLYNEMIKQSEVKFEDTLFLEYETAGFVCSAGRREIYCHLVEDLIWCEIDDYEQYRNAKEKIYPMIITSEGRRNGKNAGLA